MNKLWIPLLLALPAAGADRIKSKEVTALDRYISEASHATPAHISLDASPGSLWFPTGRLAEPARDLRASQVNDLITIVVSERASATSKGTTNSSRKSSAKNSVSSIFGPTRLKGPLADLARVSGESQLDGKGETSRETVMTTTLSARVIGVLPNGYLVVEGVKDVLVNSESQMVSVRGVVRPADLSPLNIVRSDRLALLEVRINGKGVVGDAIKRPFFLYRLLLGLFPF